VSEARVGRKTGGALGALAVGAALSLVAAPASGTNGRAYLPDATSEIRALAVSPLRGWVEMAYRARLEEAEHYEIRESRVSPKLHLATDGSVYHPRFLVFDVATSLRLETYRIRGDERRDDDLAFADYDASGRFFDDRSVNGTLFARKSDAWIESPYRGSTRMRAATTGAELRTKGPLPLTLTVSRDHREEEFSGDDREEDRDRFRASTLHRTSRSQTSLSYRWVDTQRNLQLQDYQTSSADLRSTLRPSADSPSSLRSAVRWFHQSGTLRRRDLGLTEDLRIGWSETLESTAGYRFSEQTGTDGPERGRRLMRSHRGEVGVRHDLWGSLETTLALHASRHDVFDRVGDDRDRIGRDDRRGFRGDLAYRRATPWGRLHLGVGHARAREDQTAEDQIRQVANESYRLEDGNEPLLASSRVDPASIVVSDATGFTVYVEGIDYDVVTFGDRVSLRRIPGGDIADGETLLVDYRYEVSPALEFDTIGTTFRSRFDSIRNVSAYYRYGRHREDYVSGIANGFLEDRRDHVAGLRFRARGFTVGEEYEVNRLLASEFRTNRVDVGVEGRIGSSVRGSLRASHSRRRFTETDRELAITALSGGLTVTPRPTFVIEGRAWVRLDRTDGESAGVDADLGGARLEIKRRWREISAVLGGAWHDSDRNGFRDRRTSAWIALRRTFAGGRS
jgi:hypothetical protein